MEKKPYEPVEMEVVHSDENDRRPDDISNDTSVSMDQLWIQDPVDISEEPEVIMTSISVPEEKNNKTLLKKNDISTPKKDWPGNRSYLYGLTSDYNPIAYRYIPKYKMSVDEQIRVRDGIIRDFPNVVVVYIVDNSRDIHEAFNRAKAKYRPTEDRAIFKCMLESKGIKLFERSEDK